MKNAFVVLALLCALVLSGCGEQKSAENTKDKFAGTWVSENHSMYIWPCGAKYILEYSFPSEDDPHAMKKVKVPAEPKGGRLYVTVRFDEQTIAPMGNGDMLVFQDRPYKRTQTVSELGKRKK